jgi:2-iminobutanoate/2-iminopropanoate deaminase
MSRKIIQTKNAPSAIGPYSQGVIVNQSVIYTAGQIAINPATGVIVEGGIKEQTARVLENLKAILDAGGSNLRNVVKTTVFLKDMTEFAAMNEVYGAYFTDNPPARTTVEVSRLPRDVRIEIEAVALVIQN